MKYIKNLITVNNIMNPAALFPADYAEGKKTIECYSKGYLTIADAIEHLIVLAQRRKETI